MKIKNISTKIIGVGPTVLMPDAVADIEDKYVYTDAVTALIKMGMLKSEKKIVLKKEEKKADIDASSVTIVTADSQNTSDDGFHDEDEFSTPDPEPADETKADEPAVVDEPKVVEPEVVNAAEVVKAPKEEKKPKTRSKSKKSE